MNKLKFIMKKNKNRKIINNQLYLYIKNQINYNIQQKIKKV